MGKQLKQTSQDECILVGRPKLTTNFSVANFTEVLIKGYYILKFVLINNYESTQDRCSFKLFVNYI